MKFTKLSKTICLALFALHITPTFAPRLKPDSCDYRKSSQTKSIHFLQINEVGKIRATDSTALTFSASDKILNIHFKRWNSVKKGELIAQLDNAKRSRFRQARSSLALAKSKLKRVQKLLKKQPDSIISTRCWRAGRAGKSGNRWFPSESADEEWLFVGCAIWWAVKPNLPSSRRTRSMAPQRWWAWLSCWSCRSSILHWTVRFR